jgi:choline monooxygenase
VHLSPTLALSAYVDGEVWQRERAEIWAKEWIHVGYRHQVDRPGGYVTEELAGWQIVIHRGTDGELRAFHNVCPHRAGPIFYPGEGCQHGLVCRYHGWAFEPTGSLRVARDFGADIPDGVGLIAIRVHDWRGLLFICMSGDTPEFDEWVGDFAAECREFPIETYRFHTRTVRHVKCNWKTYSDNYLENYHVPLVHQAMAQRDLYALESRCITGDDRRWSVQRAPAKEGTLASGVYTWLWPNFAFDVFPGGIAIERYVPRSVNRTDVIFDYFFDDHADGVDEIIKASEEVVDEDVMIVEVVQRNLDSGAYNTGLLSPRHENGRVNFVSLMNDMLLVGGPARP